MPKKLWILVPVLLCYRWLGDIIFLLSFCSFFFLISNKTSETTLSFRHICMFGSIGLSVASHLFNYLIDIET